MAGVVLALQTCQRLECRLITTPLWWSNSRPAGLVELCREPRHFGFELEHVCALALAAALLVVSDALKVSRLVRSVELRTSGGKPLTLVLGPEGDNIVCYETL